MFKNEKFVRMLTEGSEFGNKQFLKGLPFGYTYKAYNHNVKCIIIERLSIERIMGVDVLKFEIDNL